MNERGSRQESILFQLIHEIGILKVFGNGIVEASNDFVNGLFPRSFTILLHLERAEKFAQRCLANQPEVFRNLLVEYRESEISTHVHWDQEGVSIPKCDCFGCSAG